MIRFLIYVLIVAGLIFAVVRWLEQRMLFAASEDWSVDVASVPGAREMRIATEDGVEISAVWVPHEAAQAVVLHCHGNAGNLSHRFELAEGWRRRFKVSVLLFDYRGYGRSEGSPSEAALLRDARAAYREARRLGGELPVVVSGRSLGTVPATRLASEVEVRALLLDSPMRNSSAMAGAILGLPLPSFLLASRLDNEAAIARVRCPLLVLHGTRDRIVPFAQGEAVFAAAARASSKRLVALEAAGHNDPRDSADAIAAIAALFAR